jgi:hypothetical protein
MQPVQWRGDHCYIRMLPLNTKRVLRECSVCACACACAWGIVTCRDFVVGERVSETDVGTSGANKCVLWKKGERIPVPVKKLLGGRLIATRQSTPCVPLSDVA